LSERLLALFYLAGGGTLADTCSELRLQRLFAYLMNITEKVDLI